MRYHKDMQKYPQLIQARGCIDKLYLDTTYCHPKHVFPTQQQSIQQIGDAIAAVLGVCVCVCVCVRACVRVCVCVCVCVPQLL